MSRKQRFRAALALAGISADQWATENGITRSHLWQVLGGLRESRSLLEKVDSFIDKHLRAHTPAA